MKRKIGLGDIDIELFKKRGYKILFPVDNVVRIKLAGFLYQITKQTKATTVMAISKNMARSGFYKYHKSDFIIKTRFVNSYRKREDDELRIPIENKNETVVATIYTTLRELSVFKTASQTIESIRPKLSVKRAEKIREDFDTQVTLFKPDNVEQIEQVVMEICQRLASGRYSLIESCNYHNVSIFDFMKWYYIHDTVKTIYEEAFQISNFINGSSMLTQANKLIMEILKNGVTNNIEIDYEARRIDANSMTYIEKGKKVRTREVNLGELIKLVELFKKTVIADKPVLDEFGEMSDEDLLQYIRDNKKLIEN